MNFLQYISEGIRTADFERSIGLIKQYLEKSLGTLYALPEMEHYKGAAGSGIGLRYFTESGKSLRFNWTSTSASSTLESISVWDGSTKYPNYQITALNGAPLGTLSLATILPTLARVVSEPRVGVVELSTEESISQVALDIKVLRESESIHYVRSLSTSSELVLKEDAYSDVVGALEAGPVSKFNISKMGRNQERIFGELTSKYKDAFDIKTDGAGRQRFTLIGSSDDFDRDSVVQSVLDAAPKKGRTALEVRSGGAEDAYTDNENDAARQYPSAQASRIPYEEQLDDMKTIVTAVAKGASNFAIVLGAGGLGKCQLGTTNLIGSWGICGV
jgi:hypothetical protein